MSRSRALIEPHGGEIVAEYFDIGLSRALPWKRRPQAAALLESFRDPGRGFDAVVIGEPARAFYGNQFGLTFPVFVHYGIQLWVPEVGGPVDPGSDAHDLVMALYGGMSKGERNRIKVRVRAAMAAQAAAPGRYLGGRPPYGYQLGDAGPHPNPGKAAAGQRAHRLEIDPEAAPIVERIFSQVLGGLGSAAIANRLNADQVPCPSAHDPARNSHRSGSAWVASAVLAILKNPRYTGHEVWNKQRKDEVLIDVEDVALGHETRLRWNPQDKWIFSPEVVHPRIISAEAFSQVQTLLGARKRTAAQREARHGTRTYLLRGLIFCAACDRRMEGTWNNKHAHYRCQLQTADLARVKDGHPLCVYVREDRIVDGLDVWLNELFAPRQLDRTITAILDADHDPGVTTRKRAVMEQLRSCDERLARYRAALDAGADPLVVTSWISEVTAERTRCQLDLQASEGPQRLSRPEIKAIVEQMATLTTLLSKADPLDRAQIYRELGLKLTYRHEKRLVIAEATPTHVAKRGVRGGTPLLGTWAELRREFVLQ